MPFCDASDGWFRFWIAITFFTSGFLAFSSDDCREFVLGPTPFPLFAWPDPAGFLAAIPTARGFGPVFKDGFPDLPAGEFPASPVDCPPVPKVGPAEPVEFPDGDA